MRPKIFHSKAFYLGLPLLERRGVQIRPRCGRVARELEWLEVRGETSLTLAQQAVSCSIFLEEECTNAIQARRV